MTRARIAAAAATAATLAGAWAVWAALPALIAAVGLQRYGLLARVVLIFAALSLADRLVARIAPLVSGPEGQTKDTADDP